MEITFGKEGCKETFGDDFPETIKCCKCEGEARIGFVAHEGGGKEDAPYLSEIHESNGVGDLWLHDSCCVAIYFCRKCLNPTALYNQA